jgi:hypothetical protein
MIAEKLHVIILATLQDSVGSCCSTSDFDLYVAGKGFVFAAARHNFDLDGRESMARLALHRFLNWLDEYVIRREIGPPDKLIP